MPKPKKPPKKHSYTTKVRGRVFRELENKIERARSEELITKLSNAVETTYRKGAIGEDAYNLFKRRLAQRAELIRSIRREGATVANREGIPRSLALPLTDVERLLIEHVKKEPKLRGLERKEPWVANQRAYLDYVRNTELDSLFEVFFESAMRKIQGEHKKRQRNPKVERAIKRKYDWRTFHIGMRDVTRHFGYENIVSLARAIRRAKQVGIKILDFYPEKNWILLHLELPVKGGKLREAVAIEQMEKGRIVKLGDPVKYWVSGEVGKKHFKGGAWFAEHEREPAIVERYNKIMHTLNELMR
ncbi:MAG: hypothetical protein DRO07_01750 [Candidatus Iainarchaeum archaeon]|uniref:Uncharacterized protein n=1 Tax=Candidatus Iainarchaeum sp. TaxID=3101447 RepID=A0A497JIW8_9ARCH|nr:MAG: hypothetical protein DRO07_01750 [Candidatus Diapherotrites archaeon]